MGRMSPPQHNAYWIDMIDMLFNIAICILIDLFLSLSAAAGSYLQRCRTGANLAWQHRSLIVSRHIGVCGTPKPSSTSLEISRDHGLRSQRHLSRPRYLKACTSKVRPI